jgi:hypothetical protein
MCICVYWGEADWLKLSLRGVGVTYDVHMGVRIL